LTVPTSAELTPRNTALATVSPAAPLMVTPIVSTAMGTAAITARVAWRLILIVLLPSSVVGVTWNQAGIGGLVDFASQHEGGPLSNPWTSLEPTAARPFRSSAK